ncbi:hypothetical protein [Mesorhizobium sp. IMUNJ 23232]|uniref:hypothetical protein n=1 Tax=Mesorhizobium sp. IMUNJ 23232 TaxID=3376064 RepID=UPI0037914C71
MTLVAAQLNRRKLLLYPMALFILGNVLSAFAANPGMFAPARWARGQGGTSRASLAATELP